MTRRTGIEIDPLGLEHNLNVVRQLVNGCKLSAMVKANAYGCGYQSVLPVLYDGVDAFGVACLNEAIVIRQLGFKTPCILFQGTFSSQDYPLIDEYGFDVVIHSEQQLQQFISYSFKQRIRCWLKVDTGMHRLGITADELPRAIETLNNCAHIEKPIGIMTHYACADNPEHPINRHQQSQFKSIYDYLGSEYIYSISNSGAIVTPNRDHYDMVRPGIMIYGGCPLKGNVASEIGLKPVSYFYSQIMTIKTISKGETVGYGAIWQAKRKTRLAVVAAGYGDGYPRHINDQAYVSIKNQTAPIIGRMSMDMMTIDITDLSDICIGDRVELWGGAVPIDKVASWSGTISYELLCQYQKRVTPY